MNSVLARRRRPESLRSSSRRSRIEVLEDRRMLAAPPSVAGVNVCSTAWSTEFVDYLETAQLGVDGYKIPAGSSAQLTTLPWANLDQIRIRFNKDVSVQMGDLSVSGVNTTAYPFSDFSYEAALRTATWTLSQPIAKDKLLIDLDANGIDPVKDASQFTLDGDWIDGTSTYNSGNGVPEGDFAFRFNVLPGDAYASGSVTTTDSMLCGILQGKQAGDPGYNIRYDVDGDGMIATVDYSTIYGHLGDALPVGNPVGMFSDAPTTAGFAAVNVDEDAADAVLNLFDAFDDAEDDDDDLTYQIIGNTNPDLFESVDVDGVNGELTLDFAFDQFGEAMLTIRATDSAGLIVDTTLAVNVQSTNQAPVISGFTVSQQTGGQWLIRGTVTDADDDVEGMVITFGGVLEGYDLTATVLADGSFSVAQTLTDLVGGTATAQTEDDEGAESNVAQTYIIIS